MKEKNKLTIRNQRVILIMLFTTLIVVVSFLTPTSLSLTTAPENIQTAQNTASIGSGTFTVTLGSPPTSGNTLFLTYASSGQPTNPTISSVSQTGVTWTKAVSEDGLVNVEIWYGKIGANAGNTATITIAGSSTSDIGNVAHICEWTKVATINPLDKTAVNTGQGNTGETGTTAVTSQSNELFVGAIGTARQHTAAALTDQHSPTNSYTLSNGIITTSGQYTSLAELIKVSTTTETASSGTSFGSTYWAGCIATFKTEVTSLTPTPTATPIQTTNPTQTQNPTSHPTQTTTQTPTSSPSPTPTVPEFPTLIILPLFAIILLSMAVIKKRLPKKSVLLTQKL